MKIYDVIILGAGASGLMCASNIGRRKKVAILESNDKIAQKLKISGGGKCNITNTKVSDDNFDGSSVLVKHALKTFSRDNLLEFLERNNIELELRKGRYYFCKKSAQDIIDALARASKYADIILNTSVTKVIKTDEMFEIETNNTIYTTKQLIIASGGKSFTHLGGSDIGLQIAKSFDIEVREFTPALVGLTVQKEQFWMKELSGLSCYVHIRVAEKLLQEELLFTHKGISGPAVLSASLYWKKGNMSIDFLPNHSILELVSASKKLISSTIPLPKRLSKALLKAINVDDKECHKISKQDKEQLALIHSYNFSPAGNFGFTKAEVSRGGVVSEELDIKRLESKKVQGLYFIGEVVDITGELGGYNFQWAFSSAYLCAKMIK